MRKFFTALAAGLLTLVCSVPLSAQVLASGPLVAAADTVLANPGASPSVSFQVTGTWSGTVTFQGSADCGTYVSVLVTSATDGSTATTTTANGVFFAGNGGYQCLRANATSWTSGRASVTIAQGYAQAKVASPQFSNISANAFCMSASTKDSYFQEVGANNPGAYTGATSCASGTLRFDWGSAGLNLNAIPLFITGSYLKVGTVANAITTAGAMNIPNNVALYGENAAGNGILTVIKIGTGNAVELGDANTGTVLVKSTQYFAFETGLAFAALGTPSNGYMVYCTDCTIANPCASGGSGALAKRLNGVWVCN